VPVSRQFLTLQLLADQLAPQKSDVSREEQRVERCFRWPVSEHHPSVSRLVAGPMVRRTYRVTNHHWPERRRLWGHIYTPDVLRRIAIGPLALSIPPKTDEPWDLFGGSIFSDVHAAGPYHPGDNIRIGVRFGRLAGAVPMVHGTPKRARENGMLEEAVRLEIIPESFSKTEELID